MKKQNLLLWSSCIIFGLALLTSLHTAGQNQSGQHRNQTADEYFNMLRNNQVTGMVDPQDELTARQKTNDMLRVKNGNALNLDWSEVGPDNLGGRTRAIVFDVANPQTVYAASVNGGVWKSTSGGTSWAKMTINGSADEILNATCMVRASDGTIYVGTGESFENKYSPVGTVSGTGYGLGGMIGKGIYKSTDGSNFTAIASTVPTTANSMTADWAYINELGVTSTGRVFACTNKGLRYSDDGGSNWTFAKSNGSNLTESSADIKVGSSGIIVAVVGNKCYISTDGNPDNFVNVSLGGAGNLPLPTSVSRIEAAIAPSNNDIIYVMVAKANGALENIYRNPAKGVAGSWSVVGPGGSSAFNVFNSTTDLTSGQGLYTNTITVTPDNADVILVGGVNMWRGVKIDNGYFSWNQTCDGLVYPDYYPLYVHTNHHCYVYHPTNPTRMMIGTDGGIFMTTDGAQTFQNLNRNFNASVVNKVAASHKGEILAGSMGSGSFYISRVGNTPMEAEQINRSNGGSCAVSFINPKAMFISVPNSQVRRTINKGANFDGFYASAMNSVTGPYITPMAYWENVNFPASIDSVKYIAFDTIMPNQSFKIKSNNGDYPFTVTNNTGSIIWPKDTVYFKDPVQTKMFVGAYGSVWYTRGAIDLKNGLTPTWFKLSNFTMTVSALAVTPDGNTLFAGTQDGYILRFHGIVNYNSDVTNDLEVDTLTILTGRYVTGISINPKNANEVLVTLGNYGNTNYVYFSDNALSASPVFNAKQGNLPAMPVYTALIELNGSGRVLIGTEMGIFSTGNITAGAPSWSAESTGIGNVPVMDLKQVGYNWYPVIESPDTMAVMNYGAIYAATAGRGIFECLTYVGIDNPESPVTTRESAVRIYPNPVADMATIAYDLKAQGNVTFEIFDITGKVLGQRSFSKQTAGEHLFSLPVDQLAPGAYFIKMTSGQSVETARFIKK